MLSGTCGICRDGIPREPALGDPPLPVAAVVWLGGPSPRWGSARWVSAPRDLWDCHFLGLGRPEVPRGAWEWRGLAWGLGSGRGAEPLQLCVDGAQTREVQRLAPPALLGTVLPSGSYSSVYCLAEPFAVRPTPISRKAGSPRLSPD